MTTHNDEFSQIIDRRTSNSMKWGCPQHFLTPQQQAADPLPMWVADMDFQSPQAVTDALREAVEFGIFGYPHGPTQNYLSAVSGWQQSRFGHEVSEDWVVPIPGVITALKTIIQAFSAPGDSVLIQPPVYVHFHNDVLINGRHIAPAPLLFDGEKYRFDAQLFESAIQDNTKIFILSNPHNPTGNVWTEDELRTMGEICIRRGILVISDEIHQDFILNPSKKHIPFFSLGSDFALNSITCTSASKTFNLAGLQCANMFIPRIAWRKEIQRQIDRNLYNKVNLLGMIATEAAYTHGAPWVDELLDYIRYNHHVFSDGINSSCRNIKVLPMDSLYLAWIDCRQLGMTAPELEHFMLTQARVWLDKGQKFGLEGHGFMRANLGCPLGTVREAVKRMKNALA